MNYQTKSSFYSLIPLLKPYRRDLIIGSFCIFIYVSCWPLLASLAGKLIPAIGKGEVSLVIDIIIKALAVFLVQKTAQFVQDTILARPALLISQDIRLALFRRLQKVKLNSLKTLSSGDITYRLTEDADRIGEVIYKTIQDTTPSIFQLLAVLGYMFYLDWQLSLATFLLAPIITILVSWFGKKVMIAAEKSQRQVSDLAGLLTEALQGLPLVRAYAVEEWLQDRFRSQVKEHRIAKYKTLKLSALQHPIVGFIEACGILSILVIGALRIRSGGINSQEFSSYFAAILMLIDPISHITSNYNELQQAKASLKRLKEIENEEIENISKGKMIKLNPKGEILFNNVEFAYLKGTEVLRNLNLTIKSGQVVALVGASGAGKSTIFSLLLKFIEPKKGQIMFDNINLNNINSRIIRKEIALVPQNNFMFSGTIYEAITFGRNVKKEEVIKSAQIANADVFINELPEGYYTRLQERGGNLSGGQLQRIAIARALIGNPSVLLLDEATSALDAEAEEAVQIGLKQAMLNRTVIIIAHRLSTVQEANKIVLLENGAISEVGSHDQLIQNNGRYADICKKQFIRTA